MGSRPVCRRFGAGHERPPQTPAAGVLASDAKQGVRSVGRLREAVGEVTLEEPSASASTGRQSSLPRGRRQHAVTELAVR